MGNFPKIQPYNPLDTQNAFRNRSLLNLLSVYALMRSIGSPRIVDMTVGALKQEGMFGNLARCFVENTVFLHFTGGETLNDTWQIRDELIAWANVGIILDNSTEEGTNETIWNTNLANKLDLIDAAASLQDGPSTSKYGAFVPLKVTALCCPAALESIASHLAADSTMWHSGRDLIDIATEALDTQQSIRFAAGLARLRALCARAHDLGVSILLDAEQTQRQPAIELVAHILWREFCMESTCDSASTTLTIYNTYQMYLNRSPDVLQRDMALARKGSYRFAAKIVRGAYLTSERDDAIAMGLPDPIVPSKVTTPSSP